MAVQMQADVWFFIALSRLFGVESGSDRTHGEGRQGQGTGRAVTQQKPEQTMSNTRVVVMDKKQVATVFVIMYMLVAIGMATYKVLAQ